MQKTDLVFCSFPGLKSIRQILLLLLWIRAAIDRALNAGQLWH